MELTNFIEPFVEVTRATFKDFVGIEVSPRHPHYMEPEKVFEWDVSSVIGLSGAVRGAVIISMKTDLAIKLADILVGPPHTEIDADVVDAIGEVVNIIAGNIKPKVPNGDKIVISIPTTIRGKELSIAWPSKQTRVLCIPYKVFENDFFHLLVAIDYGE
ncbi:MAG: chemotaxis protein CheX [Treponema sp.]|jgi:chemotaxis protein CheX|nr:chemotaxis protein CheX [Treponema sp.]